MSGRKDAGDRLREVYARFDEQPLDDRADAESPDGATP